MKATRHGTRSQYTNQGCRCVACCEAHSNYMKGYARKRIYVAESFEHGTWGRYRAGCKCEACYRLDKKSQYRKKYGIELEEFEALVKAQDGKCFICDTESRLMPDHCHVSGKFRGALCNNCNTGLGKFKDNVEVLQRAINYLNA
jgi:hypothetical protein